MGKIISTSYGPIEIRPYRVSPDHWEYRLYNSQGTYWDSIECDNGVKAQQAKTRQEAIDAGVSMTGDSTIEFEEMFNDAENYYGVWANMLTQTRRAESRELEKNEAN